MEIEICGCGRRTRYGRKLPDGTLEYSCNKYGRCLSPEEQKEKEDAAKIEKEKHEAREIELAYQRYMRNNHSLVTFSDFKEIFAEVLEYRRR